MGVGPGVTTAPLGTDTGSDTPVCRGVGRGGAMVHVGATGGAVGGGARVCVNGGTFNMACAVGEGTGVGEGAAPQPTTTRAMSRYTQNPRYDRFIRDLL